MADVIPVLKVRCDNCGVTADKIRLPSGSQFSRPRNWGELKICSGRGIRGYPPDELRFVDLCPRCAIAAHDAAAQVLRDIRLED